MSAVNVDRTLTELQRHMVRCIWMAPAFYRVKPAPSLIEVRWSDDYRLLYVPIESGLLSCGFLDPTQPPPVEEGSHHYVFSRANMPARSLLEAIKEVVDGRDQQTVAS